MTTFVRLRHVRAAVAATLAAVAVLAHAGTLPTTYQVTLLDQACGLSSVSGINNSGAVSGGTVFGYGAVCKDGVLTLVEFERSLTHLNKSGEASVNWGNTPWVYKKGKLVKLPTPTGTGAANGINDAGVVAGEVYNNTWVHAVTWTGKQAPRDLHQMGTGSQAFAINKAGQVVGLTYYEEAPFGLATLWEGGGQSNLGSLYTGSTSYSRAVAINDKGWVVGSSAVYQGQEPERAWLWQSGNLEDLATWPGASVPSRAAAINVRGQIVGFMIGEGRRMASLWQHGKAYELNALIDPSDPRYGQDLLDYATGINDVGEIIGQIRVQPGQAPIPFLLKPVSKFTNADQ